MEPRHRPFQQIGLDLLGPFPTSTSGNKWIVVATDYLSRYAETRALPKGSAAEVAKFFVQNIVLRHRAPEVLITDRGTAFTADLTQAIFKGDEPTSGHDGDAMKRSSNPIMFFVQVLLELLLVPAGLSRIDNAPLSPAMFSVTDQEKLMPVVFHRLNIVPGGSKMTSSDPPGALTDASVNGTIKRLYSAALDSGHGGDAIVVFKPDHVFRTAEQTIRKVLP